MLKLIKSVCLTLCGVFALATVSHGALADAASNYNSMCAVCHGSSPGHEPGGSAIPIDLSKFPDDVFRQNAISNYINFQMPANSPSSCVEDCASQLAAYLLDVAVQPNQPPEIVWTGFPFLKGEAPFTVTFDVSASSDDDSIASFSWNFGDSTFGTGPTPSHTYSSPGLYDVVVTATDSGGLQTQFTGFVQVRSPGDPLTLDIRWAEERGEKIETKGEVPFHVSFNAKESHCENGPCEVIWDWGDDSDPTIKDDINGFVNHTYSTANNYTLTVTTTDADGNSETTSLPIEVEESPSLADYVESCKSILEFDDDDIPPTMECGAGELFAFAPPINDFVGHVAVTDQVDLTFACRWAQNNMSGFDPPFIRAVSIEMIMHNRENGNTCFFKANTKDGDPSSSIVSPTVAAYATPDSPEAKYWAAPIDLKRELPCTDCHVAGPYIVSPRIAPSMQKLGLVNDGHDTFGLVHDGGDFEGDYNIVGDIFHELAVMAADNNLATESTCANGCHAVGFYSTVPPLARSIGIILPPLAEIITEMHNNGVMPPNNPPVGTPDESNYTWINRDTPLSGSNDSDTELFSEAKVQFETILNYCEDPGKIVSHVTGSDLNVFPDTFDQNIRTFNAKEGLVCVNADQGSGGMCYDYTVAYYCKKPNGEEYWTETNNRDTPWGIWQEAGDHEIKNLHDYVCAEDEITTGIRTTYTSSDGVFHSMAGPADRLAKFDRYGLICNNNQQVDGQCSNYVVKYLDCGEAPEIIEAKIQSAWSGRILTAAGTGNNGDIRVQPNTPAWNTQDWIIEPVVGTENVRLLNTATGRYLNAQNDSDYADAILYDYVDDWGSQQWIIEEIPGSAAVKFRNVWSGFYLTASDNSNYSDLKIQPDNNWPSQRWNIQE